jgi:hypothetical protein
MGYEEKIRSKLDAIEKLIGKRPKVHGARRDVGGKEVILRTITIGDTMPWFYTETDAGVFAWLRGFEEAVERERRNRGS